MKVSIIVPYDRDRGYLSKCIDSIKAQTVPCELIKVHSPRSVVCNFNRGMWLATGDFIKVVGEDDWLPPDSVENLLKGIGDAPWICANAINVEGSTEWIERPDSLTFADMVVRNRIHMGTTMYRTEILKEIGGMDESLWTGEEYDMNLKLYSLGYLPEYINKNVYYYRMWRGQKSKQLRKHDPEKRANEIKRIQALYSDKI